MSTFLYGWYCLRKSNTPRLLIRGLENGTKIAYGQFPESIIQLTRMSDFGRIFDFPGDCLNRADKPTEQRDQVN